jgi:hypothetical protein
MKHTLSVNGVDYIAAVSDQGFYGDAPVTIATV